jgi:hypothetical protein
MRFRLRTLMIVGNIVIPLALGFAYVMLIDNNPSVFLIMTGTVAALAAANCHHLQTRFAGLSVPGWLLLVAIVAFGRLSVRSIESALRVGISRMIAGPLNHRTNT